MGTAIITGAGHGIGRAIAEQLAADGLDVVAVDVDRERAAETAKLVGGLARQCDVKDTQALSTMAASIEDLQVLVCNAAVWRFSSIVDATDVDDQLVLETNVLGVIRCCRAFAPRMARRTGAAIVNISSMGAPLAMPGIGAYSASKSAVETVTRQLAQELAGSAIRVNAVGPGTTITEGTRDTLDESGTSQRMARIPLRRLARPEDIASAVSFLVSERASYITGQVLYVDGGVTAASGWNIR